MFLSTVMLKRSARAAAARRPSEQESLRDNGLPVPADGKTFGETERFSGRTNTGSRQTAHRTGSLIQAIAEVPVFMRTNRRSLDLDYPDASRKRRPQERCASRRHPMRMEGPQNRPSIGEATAPALAAISTAAYRAGFPAGRSGSDGNGLSFKTPRHRMAWETRASANTSGPDSTWAAMAGETADLKDPHRTKKTCFFCRTGFRPGTPRSKMRSSRLT